MRSSVDIKHREWCPKCEMWVSVCRVESHVHCRLCDWVIFYVVGWGDAEWIY